MKRTSLSHSLLNIILVFIESALTLLLRLDPALRRAAYPLAKRDTVVCLRLYLPHTEVYATFSYKGVLLDATLPSGRTEPDVIINAYSIQVLNVLTSHNEAQVNKLQMRGDALQVDLVKNFLLQLGLASLVQSLLRKVKGSNKRDAEDGETREQKTEDYKLRISEQQTQISTLSTKNRELETTVKELQSKQKTLMIGLGIMTLIALVAIVGWLMN
ncbi:hypothetical protein [Psychrobacter pygoscelis]|uniref:hypothetical protein n=1 Tax=Psychrobacter pygoscelis TaxID=2488563 RepID=UPI0010394690|nr:hypothetical protein [Psychrobacter pygoscelis]